MRNAARLFAATTLCAAALSAGAAETASGDRIRGAIGGNTVEGSMIASGPYKEFYAEDGTIKGDGYTGKWSVEDDAMCFQYGSDPQSCWQVTIDGEGVTWLKDGKEDGTGTILPGNPAEF